MLTLLAATRLAWEQADAWGEPVYVVERPRPLLALSGEVRQAIQIRHMYQRHRQRGAAAHRHAAVPGG